MPGTILATKLYLPPPRPNAVSRPRLIALLNDGLSANHRLTLISAPAGYGKTALVSAWLSSGQRAAAWLSLDEDDSDPTRFLTYLIAALQTIAPQVGIGLAAALSSPQPPSTQAILTALLNELTTLPDPFTLILDDYHLLDSKPIDEALAFLLEHLPPQMHLVITTREDPRLPLPRYRARGQLTELRAADLRFAPSEAADYLNQVMGLNLTAENIAALETRTEGWIAGLQLAALSLQGRQDVTRFIQSFTGSQQFVLDLLVQEVLQNQSEPVRSFMLQTAILDRFCAPLCDAVTGRADARTMLEVLERRNLFLIPLDDRRQWYRYHHLFADALQTHLLEAQPELVPTLHGRASVWHEQNGARPDAIRHALAARDLERAAGLIELAWPAAEHGNMHIPAWLAWARALPEDLIRDRPVLNVWYAFALFDCGDIEAAEARLRNAERWLDPADSARMQRESASPRMVVVDRGQFVSLPAAIAVGRAFLAQVRGNTLDTVKYASRVLELVTEGEQLRHGQASMLLGMAHLSRGDLQAAGRVFAEYTTKLRIAGNLPEAITTAVVVADIGLTLGHLREALGTVEWLLQFIVAQAEAILLNTAHLYRALGELYLERGELEAAAQHLQTSRELGEKTELPVWRYRWCIARARLCEIQGDLDGALAFLDEAERRYTRTPLPDLRPVSAMKARIWVKQGELLRALQWVHEQGLAAEDEPGYLLEFQHITLARILIARYRHERTEGSLHAALELLDGLLQAAEEGGRMGSVIEILVQQALAHQAQGNAPAARTSLERALTLARPEGYVRIFADEGPPLAEILTGLAARDGALPVRDYVLQLLSAFDSHPQSTPSASAPAGTPMDQHRTRLSATRAARPTPLIEPLSERELQVLRLLATELSGPDIARECMLSLSTVRTHTQNIYGKLGVNNRRAAVRRAEELELL